MSFLADLTPRPLPQTVPGLAARSLFIGQGQLALEVALYGAASRPTAKTLQDAWKARQAGRSAPLLVIAIHQNRAWLCGPTGETLPVHGDKDVGAIARLCAAALKQPDRHAALLFLSQSLPSLDTAAPGLRNEGLFALHELTNDAPRKPDWAGHATNARAILKTGVQGHALLGALGYAVEKLDNMTFLLKGADRRLALAVLLDQTEVPEAGSAKFGNLSPVSYALHKAGLENLDWVVVLQGDRLRLYPTRGAIGVGRRGPTETYLELQTSVLSDAQAAYLSLLFSADALKPGGAVDGLLADSQRFAAELAKDLRDRIYEKVMPALAQGVAAARGLVSPSADDLALTYGMALTVLFRLLFVAYAEDRDLLPYRLSEAYRRRSLKQKAQELAEHVRASTPVAAGHSHWTEVALVWTAIEAGNNELSVPAYDGGLFTRDPTVSKAGAALAATTLDNSVFEPALRDLLLSDVEGGGLQPVDFRSLGVREFGTIYEGLLESELSVADQDLALDAKGSYVPVRGKAAPVVKKGEIYLHDRSGARKASGSYFTKSFAVEHLLDRALTPALADHLARVAKLDEAGAAEAFFDFRVADIAMGSGHFLVAAIDRIERAFTDYLAEDGARGAARIREELRRLEETARKQLGEMADQMAFEDSQLLRRLIARRCIYGVDLNPLSVELARLAIWIHTFVPGLPLSVLDHNLVNGDALVGVGTVAEIREAFEASSSELFPVDADNLLGKAAQPLRRFANLADASMTDVVAARAAMEEARVLVGDTKALCDIITAGRLDPNVRYQFENWEKDRATIGSHPARHRALKALEGLKVFHFPVAFPEVFLRKRSGFDVILGNPPWKTPVVHELAFFARHFPGLRGLGQEDQTLERARITLQRPDLAELLDAEKVGVANVRKALTSGAFPGMGTGDPDLYKAFLWRFWNLVAADAGRMGVVLPRSAFAAKGSEIFRKVLFGEAASVDLTMLLNNRKWVFDEVHPQYTIGLVGVARGRRQGKTIALRGPFASLAAFRAGHESDSALFTAEEVLSWNDAAALPLLPTEGSLEVFAQLRKAPRLDFDDGKSWRARPYGEAHSGKCRAYMLPPDANIDQGWPVWKGESFDLERCETGETFGRADYDVMAPWLESARRARVRGSAYAEFSPEWARDKKNAPWLHPRLVYRDVARATDTRTMIVSFAPPGAFLTDKAPYFLFPRGDCRDEAYLYGVLRSLPLDWYSRRFIETGAKFYLVNSFPIPRPSRADALWGRTVALAGRLAAPDDRFADWAARVGVEHGPVPPDKKQDMIDELDAVVARLYGLSKAQLTHLFETFHEGWDYQPRLQAVLSHFKQWASN